MDIKILTLIVLFCLSSGFNYKLSKDKNRTSSLLKEGYIIAKIKDIDKETKRLLLNIKIKTLLGSKEIKDNLLLETKYFSDDFWDDLRINKIYYHEEYTIKHIIYENGCDLVLFDDLEDNSEIKNVTIKSNICHNNTLNFKPMYFDIKGTARGYKIKAGFDLK